jgi:hypothetical protein
MGAARRHRLRDPRRRARDIVVEALAGLSLRDRDLRVRDELLSFGLLATLLSFLVLPALHLSNHAPDHDHGGGALAATHRGHDGSPHHPDGDRPDAPAAPAHGHGSVAHFAAAVSAVATFVFLPAVRPLAAAPDLAPAPAPDLAFPDGCAQPRGPPQAV